MLRANISPQGLAWTWSKKLFVATKIAPFVLAEDELALQVSNAALEIAWEVSLQLPFRAALLNAAADFCKTQTTMLRASRH